MAVVSVTILFILYKNPILVAHKYLSSWCKYIYTSALKPLGFSRINTLTAKGFSNMEQTYKEIKQYTPQQEQDMLWSMFDDLWPEHEVEVERTLASELADVERKAIYLALENTNWNQSKAARQLGMGRTLLIHKIKKYELNSF